jgi:poly(ADP-ribose) glycohydrolase ARH3
LITTAAESPLGYNAAMPVSPPTLRDRFRGCILGHAIGDALGAPLEGLSGETVYRDFGPTRNWVDRPQVDQLFYSDDTQMLIGVAECLRHHGRIEPDSLMRCFADNYDPSRGYGPGTRRMLDAISRGEDWHTLAGGLFPGGSLGNGAAMRVAPVGLFFHGDLKRVAEEARESALPTHSHPIGVDAAVLVATAVAMAVVANEIEPASFLSQLAASAETEEFRWQLKTAARLGPTDAIPFGSSLEAHRSVTSAIVCFTMSPTSFRSTIASALALGNDTDTLAAIAGGISGALLGINAIPHELLDLLEESTKGRTYLIRLADELFERTTRG